jgi:hypothetical protein
MCWRLALDSMWNKLLDLSKVVALLWTCCEFVVQQFHNKSNKWNLSLYFCEGKCHRLCAWLTESLLPYVGLFYYFATGLNICPHPRLTATWVGETLVNLWLWVKVINEVINKFTYLLFLYKQDMLQRNSLFPSLWWWVVIWEVWKGI